MDCIIWLFLFSKAFGKVRTVDSKPTQPNPNIAPKEKHHGSHQPRHSRIRQPGTEGPLRRHSGQARHRAQLPQGLCQLAGGPPGVPRPARHRRQEGSLDPQTRERIALALAEQNSCEYCLSAHTAIGRKAGLDNNEIDANRAGSSHDAKAAVAVGFARALVANMGEVTSGELAAMRDAGYSESDIVEVITHVGMNILTNLLGKAGRIDIDFPKVELKLAA